MSIQSTLTFFGAIPKYHREDPLSDDSLVMRPSNELLPDVAAFLVADAVQTVQVVLQRNGLTCRTLLCQPNAASLFKICGQLAV